jgi:hypothetical protein
MNSWRHLFWLSCKLCLIGVTLIGCASFLPPTESPWEPVPTNVAATLTAIAPRSTPTPTPTEKTTMIRLDEPFKLKIGQAATIGDTADAFGILFHSVSADSRCPKQWNCLQAGEARLFIEPMHGPALLQPLFELTTDPTSDRTRIEYEGYVIQLQDLQPYPENDLANKAIKPDEYEATFIISRSAAAITPTPQINITARLNEPFQLGVGKIAQVTDAPGDLNVRFYTVLEDTRCPIEPGASCTAPSRARVELIVERGDQQARLDLSTYPDDHLATLGFNGYLVDLLDIAPPPSAASPKVPWYQYQVSLRVRPGSLNVEHAHFNEPFTLKVGQAVDVADSPLRVTFAAVKHDARCPIDVICEILGAAEINVQVVNQNATEDVALEVGGAGHRLTDPAIKVYAVALNPHPNRNWITQTVAPGDYEATFLIVNPAPPDPTPTPHVTPTLAPLTSCPALTHGDAAEILGEAIKDNPAEIVLFQAPNDSIKLRGLCGYGSVALTPDRPTPPDAPFASPASMQADHAVVAGRLTDLKRQEILMNIADVIDAANPAGSGILSAKMQTYYAAGAWFDDMLSDFPAAAEGAAHITVKSIDGLGDHALWAWREFTGGRYAALVTQHGETLFVVTALVNEQRTAESLQPTMMAVLQKMMR